MDAAVDIPPFVQVFEDPRDDPDCFPKVNEFMQALQDPGETPRQKKHGAKSGTATSSNAVIVYPKLMKALTCFFQIQLTIGTGIAAQPWQTNLILFVCERRYTLWKQRNQEVHGHYDRTSRTEASKREIRSQQLTETYRNRSMYGTHVQNLLHTREVEDHEQHSLGVVKNWLSINAPIFRESFRRVKRQAMNGMRSIREYFSEQ